MVFGKKKLKVLAIGPHPDDLEIGCGGTLVKLAKAGHEIHLAVMTRGGAGGDSDVRWAEQKAVARFYGARSCEWLGYEDTLVPSDKESIDKLDAAIQAVKPDVVFANWERDTHQDHRNTAAAVLSATRFLPNVLFYEVPTSVDFVPDVYVDITGVVKAKEKALKLHKSQLNKANVAVHNILDIAESMAAFRGFQGRLKAAEGFKALRLRLDL